MISESLCTLQGGKQSTERKKISTEIEVSKEREEQNITLQGDTGKKGGVTTRKMESKLAFAVLGIDLTERKRCQESVWTAGKDKYKEANGD